MSVQQAHPAESDLVERALVARSRAEIANVQYQRALKRVREAGDRAPSQSAIARKLHISQPALSKALKAAAVVEDVPEGFSGASPREICQLYAIGELDREQLVDELSRWAYPAPVSSNNAWDDLSVALPGSWDDVDQAAEDGLIDYELLDEVLDALPEDD